MFELQLRYAIDANQNFISDSKNVFPNDAWAWALYLAPARVRARARLQTHTYNCAQRLSADAHLENVLGARGLLPRNFSKWAAPGNVTTNATKLCKG